MKKIMTLGFIMAVIALMSNCSPKVAKTGTKTAPKKEEPATATRDGGATNSNDVVTNAQGGRSNAEQIQLLSQANDQRLEAGGKLYAASCKQCHDLNAPDSRDANAWVEIMKDMGPKAKLDLAAYLSISSYLVKNAKK